MFCDDPDGEFLDIDDIRCVWEEFVDALRDASAKAGDPRPKATSMSYADVEQPAMQRSPSFARLVENLSSEASGASTPGTPAIDLVSRHGMILGVGCSSRDNSARGDPSTFAGCKATRGSSTPPRSWSSSTRRASRGLTPVKLSPSTRYLMCQRCPFFNANKKLVTKASTASLSTHQVFLRSKKTDGLTDFSQSRLDCSKIGHHQVCISWG